MSIYNDPARRPLLTRRQSLPPVCYPHSKRLRVSRFQRQLWPRWRTPYKLSRQTLRYLGGRRYLARRCLAAGLVRVGKGVWYEPGTDAMYASLLNETFVDYRAHWGEEA